MPSLKLTSLIGAAAAALVCASLAPAQSPRVHRLPATPLTVAYGYYWSEKAPALRIASGDIIDVETMIHQQPAAARSGGGASERDSAGAARHRLASH